MIFFLHVHNHWEYLLYIFLKILVIFIFCSNYFSSILRHSSSKRCVLLKRKIPNLGYHFLMCNRYHVYLLMNFLFMKLWPILVIQLSKSRVFFNARVHTKYREECSPGSNMCDLPLSWSINIEILQQFEISSNTLIVQLIMALSSTFVYAN